MKRVWIILGALLILTSISAAKITVHGTDVKTTYNLYDLLSGTINLTLKDILADELITSNREDSITLKDFLDNGATDYDCSVPFCEKSFKKTSGKEQKTITVEENKTLYAGFYLKGEQISVTGVTFKAKSDFDNSEKTPLSLSFFERANWTFSDFSEKYSARNYGCYNPTKGVAGPKLRNAKYCELISLTETAAILTGADVEGTDTKLLKMVLHPETGGDKITSCNYDPAKTAGCTLRKSGGNVFSAGTYQVCVEENSLTNYTILSETEGQNCGFAFEFGPKSSERDYAIHASTARYANASSFNSSDFKFGDITLAADTHIDEAYNRNCTEGCILPIMIRGIEQDLTFSDIVLDYKVKGVAKTTNQMYSLTPEPITIDFSGTLDLRYTEFNVTKGGDYSLFLKGTQLFKETFDPIETPEVIGIFPQTVPAGVPITFRAVTTTTGSGLKYRWEFSGNTSPEETRKNSVTHLIPSIGKHSVTITVTSQGSAPSKKTFDIQAINPKEAVNETLTNKKKALDTISTQVKTAPAWYRSALEQLTNISKYQLELSRIETEAKRLSNQSGIVKVATQLYALETPTKLDFDIEPNINLLSTVSEIDPEPVARIDIGKTVRGATKYASAVANWQETNILPRISSELYKLSFEDEKKGGILRAYTATIHSYLGEPGYLVLDRPKNEIVLKDETPIIASGDYSLIKLSGSTPQTFEFYTLGPQETQFYTSPVLSTILIDDINVNCNNNNICEAELGENTNTCRNDCKPVFLASFYMVLVIVLALILYAILQVWYKRHYETYLFKKRAHLYNLLMFITNARARETSDKEIVRELGNQGWSHERLVYAMKKSRGERTGMFELIPIEKLTSYLRNRAARKAVAKQNKIVPAPRSPTPAPTPNYMYGNINKQGGFGRQRRP